MREAKTIRRPLVCQARAAMGVFRIEFLFQTNFWLLESPARLRRTTHFDGLKGLLKGSNLSAGVAFGALGAVLASSWLVLASTMPPRRRQDGPRRLQDGPRRLQDGPRSPKTAQDVPKSPPRCPKMPPRRPQEPPKSAQEPPKTPQDP